MRDQYSPGIAGRYGRGYRQLLRSEVDKFDAFGLNPGTSEKINAPRIEECYASFECRLHDDAMIERYNLFIFEVVKAHAAPSADEQESLHYRGMGEFMLSGNAIDRQALFKSSMLV